MNPLLRPHTLLGIALSLTGGCLLPPVGWGQSFALTQLLEEPSPLLIHASQGYLGVLLSDVDKDRAQALNLKEARGAEITLIDHDAPAGKVGLKPHDVILKVNSETIEGAEQLRRILREIPAGRKISLVISRDGNVQTMAVELADHRAMQRQAWQRMDENNGEVSAGGQNFLSTGGDLSVPSGFPLWSLGSSLNVGALAEPLTAQMAEYLGVPNGLMIKSVARRSEAANAGFKAFDVILKVGSESIATTSDWERNLRANAGKPVPVTILRDKKQLVLTLQVDSKKHRAALELEEMFPGYGLEFPGPTISIGSIGIADADGQDSLQAIQTLVEKRALQLVKQLEATQ